VNELDAANPKIVFFGAGAIGASVGGWVAPHHDNLYFIDQGAVAATLKDKGITLYHQREPGAKATVKVKVLDNIDAARDADVLALGVKNFSLDKVAQLIKDKVGNRPIIVSMANGVENQRILPKYFSKVIYCVVSYNAWMDEPVTVGFQKKGPLILGTLDNGLRAETRQVAEIFNGGVETVVVPDIQDAIHCKIAVNLANAATTLVGQGFRPISDMGLYQTIMTNVILEGVNVIRAAGYHECKLGGMPSWRTIWMSANLPRFLSGPIFKRNVQKMNISSMAQDVILKKSKETELESITGYIVQLADEHHFPAPYNKAILAIARQEFGKPDFQPWDVKDVWARIAPSLK